MKHFKKYFLTVAFVFSIHFLPISANNMHKQECLSPESLTAEVSGNNPGNGDDERKIKNPASLYEDLKLDLAGLSRDAYDKALKGFNALLAAGKIANTEVLSIIDFSKHSSKKRLFVIDLKNSKLLFNTYVAHGRNSGREMANDFSNDAQSNKSSLGFYVTGETYLGKHGFSLRLSGEEKGINDNANSRAIVMHSAAYVSEAAIQMQGFVGRSLGCPALPESLTKPIIETIKNGTCLFLYSPDKYYAAHSTILNSSLNTASVN